MCVWGGDVWGVAVVLFDVDFDHFNQWIRSRMLRRSRLRIAGWPKYFWGEIHAGGAFSGWNRRVHVDPMSISP